MQGEFGKKIQIHLGLGFGTLIFSEFSLHLISCFDFARIIHHSNE